MIISREEVRNQLRQALEKTTDLAHADLTKVSEDTLLVKDLGINLKELPGPSSFLWNVEQSLQVRIPQMTPPFMMGGDMALRDLIDWIMEQLEAKEGINEYDEDGSGKLKPPVEVCEVCDDNYHWYAGCMGMCPDCMEWVRNFVYVPNHIKKVAKAVCGAMEDMEFDEITDQVVIK